MFQSKYWPFSTAQCLFLSFKAYSRARKVKNIKMKSKWSQKSRLGDFVCHQKLLLGALEHCAPVTIRDLLVKWGTDRHTYRHLELIGVFVVVMMMMCWWRWLPHPPLGDDLMMMNWQLQRKRKYLIVLPTESLVIWSAFANGKISRAKQFKEIQY